MRTRTTARFRSSLLSMLLACCLCFGLLFLGYTRMTTRKTSEPHVLAATNEYISKWSFDEGSGLTTQDIVGSHIGTLTNGPVWQTSDQCVSGSCLKFDGVNDFVLAANSTTEFNITSGQSFTVEVWFRTTSTNGSSANGGSMAIIDKGYNPGSGTIIPLWFLGLGSYNTSFNIRPIFNIQDNAQHSYAGTASRSTKFSDNKWHRLTGILDASRKTITLYVDGVPDGTTSSMNYSAALAMTNTRSLVIGASLNGSKSFFNGYIDEVSIFNGIVIPPRPTPTPSILPMPTPTPSPTLFPTPSPFVYPSGGGAAVCGASCTRDGDCINPSTSGALTWCNPSTHVCENKQCSVLGKATTAGSSCDCVGTRVCGQSCGDPAYPGAAGLCNDGVSECGYITAANQCSLNTQNNTVKYCLPTNPQSGYSRGLCTGVSASYLISPSGAIGAQLSAYDVFLACNGTQIFASPTPIPTPTPTPTPVPLMCIAATCVSNTGSFKFGAQLSCNVTPVSQSGAFYEGQCSVQRGPTQIQAFNLTPTLMGSPVFQPVTIGHANATYNCSFRVCVTSGLTTSCSAWGSAQ